MAGLKTPSRSMQSGLLVAFAAVLLLPGLDQLLGLDPMQSPEGRRQREQKDGTWGWDVELPARLRSTLTKDMGFRNSLVFAHSLLMVEGLRTSPSEDVLLGKEGWLFYAADGILGDVRRQSRFASEDVSWLVRTFEAHHEWLRERGIHYLLVVAPNKHTIYPEYLPDAVQPGAGERRLEQLLEALEDTQVPFLDLRELLLSAKAEGEVYRSTDTHWNQRGAYLAYAAVLEALGSDLLRLQQLAVSQRDWQNEEVRGGDLARMIGLRGRIREQVPKFPASARSRWQAIEVKTQQPLADFHQVYSEDFVTQIPASSLPRAVIFRDSFGTLLVPYLAEHFSTAAFIWRSFADLRGREAKLIEGSRPQVVIQLFAERVLLNLQSPADPEH